MVKFVRRDLTAFSDSLPQDATARAKAVLKNLGEMLVGAGTGWRFDPRTPNGTYIEIPSPNNAVTTPVSYFVNSTSGAKLLIMVWGFVGGASNAGSVNYPYISNKNYNLPYSALGKEEDTSYRVLPCDVSFAMIPPGSSSVFPSTIPNDYTTKWIPNDAIPISATKQQFGSNASYSNTFINKGLASGSILSLGLLSDPKFVMLFMSVSSTGARSPLRPQIAIGEIIGTIAQPSDDNICSKYGVVHFSSSSTEYVTDTKPVVSNKSFYMTYQGFCASGPSNFFNYCGFFDASGSWLNFYCAYQPASYDLLSGSMNSQAVSNHVRWVPTAVGTVLNTANSGVVLGDGFKGYLNTGYFRNAISTFGAYYGSRQWVGIDNNMIVAWDSTATDNIGG